MSWQHLILVGITLGNFVMQPSRVNKPSEILTPSVVASIMLLDVIFVALLVWGAT